MPRSASSTNHAVDGANGAAKATGRQVRIVAALTRRERELFLMPALAQTDFQPSITFADESDLAPSDWTARLKSWQPEVLITAWSTPPLEEAWLNQRDCPLRYVCHITGSVRHLVPRSFVERGGLVTNWGAQVSHQVAEHGLLLALAALRNQRAWPAFIEQEPERRQITDLDTRSLFGLRVGIHGFGSVACALLPLLRPFGVSLRAFSLGVPPEFMTQRGVEPANSLRELFAGSDVIFECEALTPTTHRCVSAEVLAAMPDHAVFVNIGRGAVVDEEALLREASNGRLRIALDVVIDEPLTAASPWVRNDRVMLSPHIGGPTNDRYAECGALALKNLQAFLDGTPPATAISLAAYDRAT